MDVFDQRDKDGIAFLLEDDTTPDEVEQVEQTPVQRPAPVRLQQ